MRRGEGEEEEEEEEEKEEEEEEKEEEERKEEPHCRVVRRWMESTRNHFDGRPSS